MFDVHAMGATFDDQLIMEDVIMGARSPLDKAELCPVRCARTSSAQCVVHSRLVVPAVRACMRGDDGRCRRTVGGWRHALTHACAEMMGDAGGRQGDGGMPSHGDGARISREAYVAI